ncbi:glycosyltransferase family 1 protein [Vreelandella aquamarina]|uniref:glycosyltransferase family 4 protein n=1 Tax=Vreelandella aquamarina TaxID=77097 RepID=UPI00384AF752
MRLCIVSETWLPEINGVAHTLARLSRELHQQGIKIDLVRPRPAPLPGEQPVASRQVPVNAEMQVTPVSLPGYRDVQIGLTTPQRLQSFMQANSPDVVYLATQGPLGWAARQAARRLGIPLIAGWHTNFDHYCGDYGLGMLTWLTRRYLRYFHNACSLNLVPTEPQARAMRTAGIQRVEVLARGIDSQQFAPSLRDPVLRQQWGVNEHQPVALYVGRLAAEKNLTLLQEAYQAMANVRPDMAFVVVGDGPARQQLEAQLPNAHFTGFIHQQALARYYASADIFVFPSLSETWGNVVTEAMACGLAVIAYRQAASATLIQSGHNGLTLPVGDADAFCQAAVSLCQHPADYARYGRMARLRAREQSWPGIASQFINHLHQTQEMHHATSASWRV